MNLFYSSLVFFYEYDGNLQYCTCKSAKISSQPVNKGNMW